MTKSYVGAYWGARAEGVERCAAQVVALVRRLAGYDPVLSGWRDTGDTKALALSNPLVTLDEQEMVERLLAGRNRRDMTGEVIADLGYSVYWWNGSADRKTAAKLSIAIDSVSPWVPNSVVLHLPDSTFAPNLYRRDKALEIVTTLIDSFSPDETVWTDRELVKPQEEPDEPLEGGGYRLGELVGVPAGWANFLRDGIEPRFDEAMLPASSTTQRIGGGTLVVVGDDPAAPPLRDVLAVRRAMGYAVPGAEPDGGDIAGAPVTAATGSVPGAGLQRPGIAPRRPTTGEAEHGSAAAGHQDSTP